MERVYQHAYMQQRHDVMVSDKIYDSSQESFLQAFRWEKEDAYFGYTSLYYDLLGQSWPVVCFSKYSFIDIWLRLFI